MVTVLKHSLSYRATCRAGYPAHQLEVELEMSQIVPKADFVMTKFRTALAMTLTLKGSLEGKVPQYLP